MKVIDNHWIKQIKEDIFIGDRVKFVRPYKEKAYEESWSYGVITDIFSHHIVVTSKNYNTSFNYQDFVGENRTIEIVG